MVVVIDDLGHRQTFLFVAQAIGIEVFRHCIGIQRCTVGESHARPQLEGVFGFIGVAAPGLGNPRLNLQRLRVLVGQFVGDLIEDTAVGVETAGRRIKVGVRLLLQVDKRAALHRRQRRIHRRRQSQCHCYPTG
ncbi:hypothetical protein D3C73_1094440 [compost metagenome]